MLLAGGCVLCSSPCGPVCPPCTRRLERPGPVDVAGVECRALVRYDGAGRGLVTALKYDGRRRLAAPLGRLLAELAPGDWADTVTWIPASRQGRHERGYDQGRLLARATARSLGLPRRRLLRRGPGPPQTGRPAASRHAGPRLEAARRGDQRVVLVDDVVTTGTTLSVAADVLRHAGWRPVLALAVAATPRRIPRPSSSPAPSHPDRARGLQSATRADRWSTRDH